MSLDVTVVVVNVCDFWQLSHSISDTSGVNTFRQMLLLSETTSGEVSESARHISTII